MSIESNAKYLIDAVASAQPGDLNSAAVLFNIMGQNQGLPPSKRLLYKGLSNLLGLYLRKYGRVRTFASKSEQRRIEHQTGRNRL